MLKSCAKHAFKIPVFWLILWLSRVHSSQEQGKVHDGGASSGTQWQREIKVGYVPAPFWKIPYKRAGWVPTVTAMVKNRYGGWAESL